MQSIPHSLYIHIPFCSTKCTYCAFNTYVDMDDWIEPYIQALIQEIRFVSQLQRCLLHTIFFGGGTPSLLTPQQFEAILEAVFKQFDIAEEIEISFEANPNDLNLDYLKALHSLGLNRISIGMQSTKVDELKLFQRRHNTAMVHDAVSFARQAGFDNLNLDLIYSNPYQTLTDWEKTLRDAIALEPNHLSLYALELKDGTPLRAWVDEGKIERPDDDVSADMYDLATDILAQAGFEQYEISNWSLPNHQCKHNLQYWYNLPYLGLGAGAEGFAGGVRYSSVRLPQRYIERLTQHPAQDLTFPRTPATTRFNRMNHKTEMAETLLMGFRLTQKGIERQAFQERFGADLVELYPDTIKKFVQYDMLSVDEERVRLTTKGRFLANAVIREFI